MPKPLSPKNSDDSTQEEKQLPVVSDTGSSVLVSTDAGIPATLPQFPMRIATALAEIMGEIGGVGKHGRNAFHNYNYVRIEDILEKVTPLLSSHGIVIMQSEIGRALFDNDNVVSVSYRFTIVHKSGDVWPEQPIQTGMSTARNSKGGFDDKAFNKCHTAARKYFLKALFQITDKEDGDNDADAQEDQGGNRPAPARNSQRGHRPAQNVPKQKPIWETAEIMATTLGYDAVNDWYKSLTPAEAKALEPHKSRIVKLAKDFDAERAAINGNVQPDSDESLLQRVKAQLCSAETLDALNDIWDSRVEVHKEDIPKDVLKALTECWNEQSKKFG